MLMTIEQYMKILLLVEIYKDDNDKINQGIYNIFQYQDKTDVEKKMLIINIFDKIQLNEEFIQRFIFDGIEYGFIPNLSKITTQEYLDLDRLLREGKHLNKIASILYRPITKSFNEYYDIEPYESYGKYEKIMNDVDSIIIVGALDFIKQLTLSLVQSTNNKVKKDLVHETK
jgi:hypothetical protein